MLIDNHDRPITYLRLAVTDRCNLRCRYCMPAEGVVFAPRKELLSWAEMLRLVATLTELGIDKLRLTGGEPFARRGLVEFLEAVQTLPYAPRVSITTNATLIGGQLERLWAAGVRDVNVSLDALDAGRFFAVTRRDRFDTVYANLLALAGAGFRVKVNCIVLEGQNTDQLLDFVALTRELPIAVRFLEEMPFDGITGGGEPRPLTWDYQRVIEHVAAAYPTLEQLGTPAPGSTSINFRVPGHAGTVGVIASRTRTFCGTCNRIRVDALGHLRTCLYGGNVASFAEALRSPDPTPGIRQVLAKALSMRHVDGHAAERAHGTYASMTTIGG